MNTPEQKGTTTLYLSHGAGSGSYVGPENVVTDWFIVEPRDNPEMLVRQVESLRKAGRTVREITVTPYENKVVL